MELEGSVIVITGGGSGIGEAMAVRFAAEAPKAIVVTDIDHGAAKRVAERIGGVAMGLDVADEGATRDAVAAIIAEHERIDLICLNAGIAPDGSVEGPDAVWESAWQVNLMAHVYAARHALPPMIRNGGGYILTTASAAGLLTNIGSAPYTVTKHAAVALAEWLAVTYGHLGIRVSCLCPQFVETPMLEVFDPSDTAMRSFVAGLAISPESVAESVVDGLHNEDFLILPHAEVRRHMAFKASDRDGWIRGMQQLQASLDQHPWTGDVT